MNLARTVHEAGDPQAAIAHYEQALRLSPERADVHQELGELYQEVGESDRASESFERARSLRQAERSERTGT